MLHAFETYCVRQGNASVVLTQLEKEKELLRIFLRVSQVRVLLPLCAGGRLAHVDDARLAHQPFLFRTFSFMRLSSPSLSGRNRGRRWRIHYSGE